MREDEKAEIGVAIRTTKRAGPRKLRLSASCLTDQGRVRKENQDACAADVLNGVFIVADGVGGASGGALASRAVVTLLPGMARERVKTLAEATEENVKSALAETVADLSERLRAFAPEGTPMHGMCTTVVLALVGQSPFSAVAGKNGSCTEHRKMVTVPLFLVHAGDSRAYLLEEGKLSQLTHDHSMVAVMVELGQITPEQARVHPLRNRITRCVGMEGKLTPDGQCITVKKGCRLLLCTDGLTGMLTDNEIAGILKSEKECQSACKELVKAANQAGGADNIAVVVVDFKSKRHAQIDD
jgi:protein phosphatase